MSTLQRLLRRLREQSRLGELAAQVVRIERVTLVTIILAAAALLTFAKLAGEVSEGGARAFDERSCWRCARPATSPIPSGRCSLPFPAGSC